jgi:hypothetical protein
MLRYGRAVPATLTRTVAMSQAAFFGLLLVCIGLHPGYLFARNEGGISNFGVHALTVAPFSGAFLACAVLLVAASRATPRTTPEARRFAGGLGSFAGILVVVLVTTYPYQHGVALRDLHFATGAAAICFEAGASAWLVVSLRRGRLDLAAGALELVGVALAACTVAGVLHVLFVSQLVTSAAFGVLLVRACARLEGPAPSGPSDGEPVATGR